MVDDVITDSFGLTVEHHNGLSEDGLFALNFLLSKSQVLHFSVSVLERAGEQDELLIKSLFLSFFTSVSLLDHFNILAEGRKFIMELLRLVLLSTGFSLQS